VLLESSRQMMSPSFVSVLCLAVLLIPAWRCEVALAQMPVYARQAGEVSRTDAYGNARSSYRERRDVGSFANEIQREATRGYQSLGRRLNRRGGYADFALGGDLFNVRPASPLRYPYPGADVPAVIRRTYAQYGGFERREVGAPGGDIETAIMRRRTLLDATSLIAPVHRARVSHGVGMAMPATVRGELPAPAVTPEPGPALSSLDERLRSGINRSYLQKRSEGWSLFRKGSEEVSQYRRAARAFEAAVILEPEDYEARIGRLLSHLSLQDYHTAVVLLAELTRHDPDPFSHDLNVAELYGDPVHARQVRMNCESLVQATGHDPSVTALHAFILWYVGDKDRAIAAAEDLAREHPIATFVNWPAQMRASRAGPKDTGGQP